VIFEAFDLPTVVTVAPVAGGLAVQWMWFKRRLNAGRRAAEDRAAASRREAMRAMHDALVATERAERTRDEFLARMSHELRTPLNAVIGFSRVLEANRAGNQRPEDIQLLRRVRAGGEQLLHLVEDVLEQARIARGNLTVELSDADVAAVTQRVIASHAPRAATRGLSLNGTVPWTPVNAPLDSGKFEQVLDHLIENAIKFTASGEVHVELITDGTSGAPLRLTVSDTGIGIPAERIEQIFEPFEQVESDRRRSYDGAGLGLPLARQLCSAMGCDLSVASRPGKGSRFTIEFPGTE
jgi:signal transduction histidine kinase